MPKFLPVQGKNGPLKPFPGVPDVWVVEGFFGMGGPVKITRNMVILRQGTDLAVVNSVRVDEETEAEIEKLGQIKHVIRITAGHGADDPYYASKYKTNVYAKKSAKWNQKFEAYAPMEVTHDLEKEAPFDNIEVFKVQQHDELTNGMEKAGEFELIWKVAGGKNILISGDLVQNRDVRCKEEEVSELQKNWISTQIQNLMGFTGRVFTPPLFCKLQSKTKTIEGFRNDIERLLAQDWCHLVPPHGPLALDTAKEDWIASLRSDALFGPDFGGGTLKGKKRAVVGEESSSPYKSPKKARTPASSPTKKPAGSAMGSPKKSPKPPPTATPTGSPQKLRRVSQSPTKFKPY